MAVATPSRPKAGGGRLYVVIGTVLALLSVLLFFVLGGVLTAGHGPSEKVVVAAKPIALREAITADEVTLQDVSPAPVGAFASTKLVVGQVAELNILAGQPITNNMVSKSPDSIAAPTEGFLPIPSGYVAITIPTSEQQGVAGYPQPGDYLTVIATEPVTAFGPAPGLAQRNSTVTKTVFTNLRIIRVGPATPNTTSTTTGGAQATQSQGVSTSLTVILTECDAEYIEWFLATGTLHYQLESYHDYQPAPKKPDPSCPSITGTKGVNANDVNNRYHFTASS